MFDHNFKYEASWQLVKGYSTPNVYRVCGVPKLYSTLIVSWGEFEERGPEGKEKGWRGASYLIITDDGNYELSMKKLKILTNLGELTGNFKFGLNGNKA